MRGVYRWLVARRGWVVEVAVVGGALYGALLLAQAMPVVGGSAGVVDVVVALAGCALLPVRRRWPVGVAVVLLAATRLTPYLTGAVVVALFTVAASCGRRAVVGVAVLALSPLPRFLWELDGLPQERVDRALGYFALVVGAVGWGLYRQSRRALIASLRARAELAEADAASRAERARQEVRAEIAREMHDVLGHRLSLLSVHAGALEFNTSAPRAEVVRAAGVIRVNAALASRDLREVIGVLRDGDGGRVGVADGRPQPELADLGRLVAEARMAGERVDLVMPPAGLVPPPGVGRAVFRIVQEALTNARVHAAGAPVRVEVAGVPGAGMSVVVLSGTSEGSEGGESEGGAVSSPPVGLARPVDGPGFAAEGSVAWVGGGRGLVGLVERARLAGGALRAGPCDGGFEVRAWLPWPVSDASPSAAGTAADDAGTGAGAIGAQDVDVAAAVPAEGTSG